MEVLELLSIVAGMIGMGGIISGLTLYQIKKLDKKADNRELIRIKGDTLKLRSTFVIGDLAKATALALKNHKVNGETEKALKDYENFCDELNNYLIETNVKG